MHNIPLKISVVSLSLALLAGCSTASGPGSGLSATFKETFNSDDPCSHNARNIGIGVGAVLGALVGNQMGGDDQSRIIGTVAGGALGYWIGQDMDQRRCELSKIAKQYSLDLTTKEIKSADISATSPSDPSKSSVGMSATIGGTEEQFKKGSAVLTPKSEEAYRAIAKQYIPKAVPKNATPEEKKSIVETNKTIASRQVLLVGHTDDTGDTVKNADLSEARAKKIAQIFEAEGVPKSNIYYQGAGETLPSSDNKTQEGRTKNRRVEVVDLSTKDELKDYLKVRKPEVSNYRAPEAQTAPVKNMGQDIDFGGQPVVKVMLPLNIGSVEPQSSGFSFIKSAQASDDFMGGACYNDRPRVSRGVKSLSSDNEMGEYMPGLYGTTWAAMQNGNLLTLSNVSVLRDGGAPSVNPVAMVFKDYAGGRGSKPTWTEAMTVNTYKGEKGLLYRVFATGSTSPVRCMDIVFPREGAVRTAQTNLYYNKNKAIYGVNFNQQLSSKKGGM